MISVWDVGLMSNEGLGLGHLAFGLFSAVYDTLDVDILEFGVGSSQHYRW